MQACTFYEKKTTLSDFEQLLAQNNETDDENPNKI
jgi:hypothetical protein